MIIPTIGNTQIDQGDYGDIRKRMDAFYTDNYTINSASWSEADLDTRCEAGDANIFSDAYGNAPLIRNNLVSFNRVRPIVNMIEGYQRRNRKSMIATPVENGDEMTADQYTKILMWACQQEAILETLSESFHGALVTGMDLMEVYLDYRTDPISGNIRVDRHAYSSFLIDPYFRKQDLSDCNGIWIRRYMTKKEILSILPDRTSEIINLSGLSMGGSKDGRFQYMPETYNFGPKNYLTYDSFYYRDFRSQKMLIDTNTGECKEWKGKDEEQLKLFLQQFPEITVMNQEIPTVRLAIAVENKVVFDGPNPLGIDQYPFAVSFAYYNPSMAYFPMRSQGVVRGLRSPQYIYNRRKQIELDIVEAQVSSGWVYKENALVNPNDIFMQGQGKGIALKEEAMMTDVQKILPPDLPMGLFELSRGIADELNKISNVNEELMGSATDEKAGILSMLRQGAGITGLQILFDQLDATQKRLGKILLDVVQSNFTPGKVARIIEDQPAPQFYDKAFGTYDVAVEEGFNTTTQRQMEFAQLLQMKELGVGGPNAQAALDERILDTATIQEKQKLIAAMKQQQQSAQQQQEQQAQVQMQEIQSRTELAHSRAMADQSLAGERDSKSFLNLRSAEERVMEAHKDEEQATLNKIKAIKELDSIDLDQLTKLVSLANMIKQSETNTVSQQPNY